jgi:hypothetical protein
VTTCKANTGKMTQFLRFHRTLRQVRRWLGGHDERLGCAPRGPTRPGPSVLSPARRARKGWHEYDRPTR